MKYLKDVGFVVKRINFGEADKYITIMTKHHGKIEVIAKGVRKITSRRAAHLELLNLISFQSIKSTKSYILTEVDLMSSFEDIKKSLEDVSSVFLICELVDKMLPPNQAHEDVFELIKNTIRKLRVEAVPQVLFGFQINLLSVLGFWDHKREFNSDEDLRHFIESVIERKIKTRIYS